MQRKLTIALAVTALASILLVGFGVLTMARISARSNAEDEVNRGLNVVVQFLADQNRTSRRVDELLSDSRQDLRLDSLGGAVITDRGSLRPLGNRGPGRSPIPGADDLPPVQLDDAQLAALADGETVLVSEDGTVIGIRNLPRLQVEGRDGAPIVVVGAQRISTVSSRTVAWFLGSSLVVLIGAIVGGSILAGRLARPLVAMQGTTAAIAAGDLTARVDNVGTDEVADLGQAVNRMAEDLQRSKALDRQFLMSVSHDLRTPLTAIAGYAEALSDGAATDPRAAGDVIGNHASRLNRLVGDLLDLAKLDANRFRFNVRPFDLSVVAGRTAAGQGKQAEQRGLTLRADRLESVLVNADSDRSAQAIGNLIDNALKFAASEIVVEVRTERGGEGTWAVVSVKDDGPGIPQADLAHIFDRLYTGAAQPKRAENPTGLGLAIVRELAGAMGGHVLAANNPEGGANLSFLLPVAERDQAVAGGGRRVAQSPQPLPERGQPEAEGAEPGPKGTEPAAVSPLGPPPGEDQPPLR